MSHVTCHISCVTGHMSGVRCHVSGGFFLLLFLDKLMELVVGGEGRGQMALPLNLNIKNLQNVFSFLEFKIYVYFLWASVSELQLKISAKNSTVLKEKQN